MTNPVPRNDFAQTGKGFSDKCSPYGMDPKMCSGMEDGSNAMETLEIVDRIKIPDDLPAGEYVLGEDSLNECRSLTHSNPDPNPNLYATLSLMAMESRLILKPTNHTPGWRWDCEESNQIWQSCSDIAITARESQVEPL